MNSVSRLIKNGKSCAVIIPRTRLLELGWRRGDHVTCFVEHGRLIVQSLQTDIDAHQRSAAEMVAKLEQGSAA